tara:strand:- start:2235 stop:2648 length:414 start_codon:yes stop_codon:yes gene_type:complete
MKKLCLLFLLFTITSSFSQGKKIELDEVEIKQKAFPEINISGIRYSFKERDYFIKTLLTSRFWSKDFKMKIDLTYFYEDKKKNFLLIEGKTLVKIDSEILFKNHKYKSNKRIKVLLEKIMEVSIIQNNITQIVIKTN